MSLRRQFIALFAALAVVPLLLVGLLDYVRSIDALEDVIASNTAVIAEQAAAELQERYSGPATNLALFAENTAAAAILDGDATTRAPDSASLAYLQRLRDVTRQQFAWVVYRDTTSSPVASFDDGAARQVERQSLRRDDSRARRARPRDWTRRCRGSHGLDLPAFFARRALRARRPHGGVRRDDRASSSRPARERRPCRR